MAKTYEYIVERVADGSNVVSFKSVLDDDQAQVAVEVEWAETGEVRLLRDAGTVVATSDPVPFDEVLIVRQKVSGRNVGPSTPVTPLAGTVESAP